MVNHPQDTASIDTSEPRSSKTLPDMGRELRTWGVALIVLGGIHFLLSGFLDPTWGIVLVVLGVLNLAIRARGMFIANGLALLAVGLMNIFSGGLGGWTAFGVLQLYWGGKELLKFGKYAARSQAEVGDPALASGATSPCPACGAQCPSNEPFCRHCGASIANTEGDRDGS